MKYETPEHTKSFIGALCSITHELNTHIARQKKIIDYLMMQCPHFAIELLSYLEQT